MVFQSDTCLDMKQLRLWRRTVGWEDMRLLKALSLAEGLRRGSAEAAGSYNSPQIVLAGALIIFTCCIVFWIE